MCVGSILSGFLDWHKARDDQIAKRPSKPAMPKGTASQPAVGRRGAYNATRNKQTYGQRVLQMQQQLNQIKAQRAKKATVTNDSASPYHATSSLTTSHSPARRGYYQQASSEPYCNTGLAHSTQLARAVLHAD